jgi:2-methylcitrate dehydratase PrpD
VIVQSLTFAATMGLSNGTNGVNGYASESAKTAEIVDTSFEKIPVTKILAEFVANLTFETIDPRVIQNLKRLLLDLVGIAAYSGSHVESSEPFYRATLAFSGGATGLCTVLTKGNQALPQYAALLNAAYGHTLDFDDTFAAGALHPGASVIAAALAQTELSEADGKTLLTGLAAGYEVICRISRALGVGAYDRGFHNTGTAGIFGAVAAIMKIKGANAAAVEAAFGLAGSKAAGSQQFLENGAWNKRLHPGFAAHDAFLCVALVEQGVITASKPLEGVFGFLKGYSSAPNIDNLVEGLGTEWIHLTTAIKPYPGCRMTHTGIDLAEKWRRAKSSPIKSLRLSLSPHCWMVVGRPLPNKIHPENIVDAQFSAYYQLAVAWLDGNGTGWDAYSRIHDKDVSELLDRITVDASDEMRGLAGRLEMHWENGTTDVEIEEHPIGEVSNPYTDDQLRKKFMSLSVPAYGEKKSLQVAEMIDKVDQSGNVRELMSLLA